MCEYACVSRFELCQWLKAVLGHIQSVFHKVHLFPTGSRWLCGIHILHEHDLNVISTLFQTANRRFVYTPLSYVSLYLFLSGFIESDIANMWLRVILNHTFSLYHTLPLFWCEFT